jgi:hypothetical protein
MRQRSVRACVRYVLEALMRRGDGPPRALRRDVALRRAASIEPNDVRSRMLQNVKCIVCCLLHE